MSQHEAVLLLGSNLGDKAQNIYKATEYLEELAGNVLIKSELLQTEPVEFASFNNFYNFALILNTRLSPMQLLFTVKSIEKKMGRISDSKVTGGYADREIDIDIVKYGNIVYRSRQLEIPHLKHLSERDFSKKLLEDLDAKKTKH